MIINGIIIFYLSFVLIFFFIFYLERERERLIKDLVLLDKSLHIFKVFYLIVIVSIIIKIHQLW